MSRCGNVSCLGFLMGEERLGLVYLFVFLVIMQIRDNSDLDH